MSEPGAFMHATAVLVAEGAVLIRGASGSGKSQLALALMAEARRRGLFTCLIGDDRVRLTTAGARVIVQGHPSIGGWIEERGSGILSEVQEAAGLVRCVVDLVEDPPRLPEGEASQVLLQGAAVPGFALWTGCAPQEGARRILAFLKWA
jgi:serine kinase of HPr protein (carbohydrate metabolism regulator)